MTDTDRAIREACEARGLEFKPWEVPPWEVKASQPNPYPADTAGGRSWPKAQKLRRRLLDELG